MNGPDSGKPSSATKQPVKSGNPNTNGKALDGARKQAASPVDGQAKKQQPKAWQGLNPITHRATTPTSSNGTDKSHSKTAPHTQPPASSSPSHTDKHAHDRALFLLATMIGQDAILTLQNGEQFSGVFSGATVEQPTKLQYIMKMVKRTRSPNHLQSNGVTEASTEYIGEGDDHQMVFDKEDTVDLAVLDVKPAVVRHTQNGSIASSFRTDTQISGRDPSMPRERELQRWVAGPSDPSMDLGLEDTGSAGWDQFATNERLYGVQSTYDESYYTTAIDRSNPQYKKREAEAARIAREIEGSAPADAHVAEERRRDAAGGDGLDEEEKYSGVKRDTTSLPKRAAGAYIPPSQRPITNAPTVAGAPYDPAIISSQLAKPAQSRSRDASADKTAGAARTVDATADSKAQPALADPSAANTNENSTDSVLRGLTDSFKQFANSEKLRVRQAQEAKRSNARAEKNVRLNDLKKFSENFKLTSRVPDDLVPILAKDREKQVQIQSRAEQAAKEEEERSKDKDDIPTAIPAAAPAPSTSTGPSATESRANGHRPRVSQNIPAASFPTSQGTQVPRRNGAPAAASSNRNSRLHIEPLPANLRDLHKPAASQARETPLSPTTTQKLNVNAKAFEFRPGAHAFTPTGPSPSPKRLPQRSPADAQSSSKFLERKRDTTRMRQRTLRATGYRGMSGVQQGEQSDEQKKTPAASAKPQRAFHTPPTFRLQDESTQTKASLKDLLPKTPSAGQGSSQLHTPTPSHMGHAPQIPPHFPQPQMPGHSQRGHFMGPPHHQHGPPNFDPGRMQPFGPNGSVQSSPRFTPLPVAFNNQMPGMPQFPGQQMPYPAMSPSMGYRQMQPNGQGVMMGQPGQMPPMPQGPYPRGGPGGFPPPMMGGPVAMVHQPSAGFPGGPMPPQGGYSPMPPHAQPHMPHNMQQHGNGPVGYGGSPRPGAHMMQHNGSHQSFPNSPMPHMPPPFGANPGQPHPYHMQPQRYPQMTPRQQAAMPHHGSPGMGMSGVDEGK